MLTSPVWVTRKTYSIFANFYLEKFTEGSQDIVVWLMQTSFDQIVGFGKSEKVLFVWLVKVRNLRVTEIRVNV